MNNKAPWGAEESAVLWMGLVREAEPQAVP